METVTMIKELKEYAKLNDVPIMQDEGIDFLTDFIIKHQTTRILEVGTAIGYSAIMMALANPKVKIVSIERDEERYLEAVKNVKKFDLEDRITLLFKDALDVKLNEKFDLIFLDGAKGQNINFFEHFERNLEDGGFFITDNIEFHGYVEKNEEEIKSRNLRQLVRKIKNYIEYLKSNPNYVTTFISKGDGIAVTEKKKLGDIMKIATVCSKDNMLEYEKIGANAFIFGLLDYSSGYHNELSVEEIKEIRSNYDGELFIAVNKNMFNRELDDLEKKLIELDNLNINGILFYDIAVLSIHNRLNLKTPLVWNQTHMVTNYNTCNYYYDKGCKYGVVASEITLDEIKEIKEKTKMQLFVNVLGYQVMGYSRRSLLSNYFKSIDKKLEKDNYIIENNNEDYIVREEKHGNVFLFGKPLNGSVVIKDLDIDYVILNDYNFTKETFTKALQLYVELVKTKEDKYIKELDDLIGDNRGFFFKKTIYKVKKND